MTRVELRLLGPFHALKDGAPLAGFRSDKVCALLAYLALEAHDRPVRRELLTELLWPGYTDETARHSLRSALHNLRQLLEPLDIVQATRQTVQLAATEGSFWCDAQDFAAAHASLAGANVGAATLSPHLHPVAQRAVELYQGEFMQGFVLHDCPGFTAWQRGCQQRYQRASAAIRTALDKAPPQPAANLPRPLTPFIGRTEELVQIERKVLDPAYPIITLLGEGGMGKTRLGLALAERVRNHFADGVWYVPLEGLADLPLAGDQQTITASAIDLVAAAIGHALSLSLSGQNDPVKVMLGYLAEKRLLLVLDNFEHFVDAAELVLRTVQQSPKVAILITSRRRLNLQAEYVVRLHGLPVPASAVEGGPTLAACSSVELFLERADRSAAGFRPRDGEWQDIARICRLVEGMPLGVELAAALVEHTTVHEIAQSIQSSLDRLSTTMRDVPPRHRSLRAVFESSWVLLSEREARALACWSIFRGGFTAEAALAVAGVGSDVLAALVNASLLRGGENDRYEMHSFIREAAEGKLAAMGAIQEQVRSRHCAYYAELVAQRRARFESDRRAVQECTREASNLITAWNLALEQGDEATLAKMIRGMSQLLYLNGVMQEGATSLGHTAAQLRSAGLSRGAPASPVLGRVLLEQSIFLDQLGRSAEAIQAAQEVIDIGERLGDAYLLAGGHLRLAAMCWVTGDWTGCEAEIVAALNHVPQAGERRFEVVAWIGLGNVQSQQGRHAQALAAFEQALQLAQEYHEPRLAATILSNLSHEHRSLGHFWRARELREEALCMRRGLGDVIGVANSLSWLASDLLLMGDVAGARKHAEEADALLGRIASTQHRGYLAVTQALLLSADGELDEALTLVRRWLETTEKAELWPAVAHLLRVEGWILAAQGRYDEAFASCQRALATAQRLSSDEDTLLAQIGLAQNYLALNNRAAARELADSVAKVLDLDAHFGIALEGPNAYLVSYRVLAALADPRADAVLSAGARLLHTIASEISDPAARRRFLVDVPANRALMAAARAKGLAA